MTSVIPAAVALIVVAWLLPTSGAQAATTTRAAPTVGAGLPGCLLDVPKPGICLSAPASADSSAPARSTASSASPSAVVDWSIVSSPNGNPIRQNYLTDVTCASASDCWAVGYYVGSDGAWRTLIERWDGTAWAIVGSPNAGTKRNNVLEGVSCVSAADCWAVGAYYNGAAWQTLIEHWDGTSWVIVTSPNTNTTRGNDLRAVTCVSSSDCWAAGTYHDGALWQTLIERWNGTSWTIVTSPTASGAQGSDLRAVTCVSAAECWAVGLFTNGTTVQTLILRWSGTAWAVASSPNAIPAQSNALYGVTCFSATDCWAVGSTFDGNVYGTLVQRWDGTSWALNSGPNILVTQNNVLSGVTCASASDCWAVGFSYPDSAVSTPAVQTLMSRWDGASWSTLTSSPNMSDTQVNVLTSATCGPESECWAVGYYSVDRGAYRTLTARYSGFSDPAPVVPEVPYPAALLGAAVLIGAGWRWLALRDPAAKREGRQADRLAFAAGSMRARADVDEPGRSRVGFAPSRRDRTVRLRAIVTRRDR